MDKLQRGYLTMNSVQCGINSLQWLCEGYKFILRQIFEKVLRSSSTLLVWEGSLEKSMSEIAFYKIGEVVLGTGM